MARSRSSFKSFLIQMSPALLAACALYATSDRENVRVTMNEAAKDAASCVENVKGIDIVDVRAARRYGSFSQNDSLRTSFIALRQDKQGNEYELKAHVTTALQAQGDLEARASRQEFNEKQKTVSQGNLREVLAGVPSNKGGTCAAQEDGRIVSCLIEHGWREGHGRVYSPLIKTGQRVRDDHISITFDSAADGTAGKITEARKRPPYEFEYNDGAPLENFAAEAATSVAACHEQALEKHFGPAP